MGIILCICNTNDLMVTYIAALTGIVIAVVMGFNILQYINIHNRIKAVKKTSYDLMKRSDQIEGDYNKRNEELNKKIEEQEIKNFALVNLSLSKTYEIDKNYKNAIKCIEISLECYKKVKDEMMIKSMEDILKNLNLNKKKHEDNIK